MQWLIRVTVRLLCATMTLSNRIQFNEIINVVKVVNNIA